MLLRLSGVLAVGAGTRRRTCASPWNLCWAGARIQNNARMALAIKLDRNWSSFQLASSAPPLSVTDSAIPPPPFRKDVHAKRASGHAMTHHVECGGACTHGALVEG